MLRSFRGAGRRLHAITISCTRTCTEQCQSWTFGGRGTAGSKTGRVRMQLLLRVCCIILFRPLPRTAHDPIQASDDCGGLALARLSTSRRIDRATARRGTDLDDQSLWHSSWVSAPPRARAASRAPQFSHQNTHSTRGPLCQASTRSHQEPVPISTAQWQLAQSGTGKLHANRSHYESVQ